MIYLDSCILIYAVEDGPFTERVRHAIEDAADTVFAISPLVELECLVGPLRVKDLGLVDRYRDRFREFRSLEADRDAYLRAAELRAAHGLKTVDALHLAIAQLAGCEALWTNDDRLHAASRGLAVRLT